MLSPRTSSSRRGTQSARAREPRIGRRRRRGLFLRSSRPASSPRSAGPTATRHRSTAAAPAMARAPRAITWAAVAIAAFPRGVNAPAPSADIISAIADGQRLRHPLSDKATGARVDGVVDILPASALAADSEECSPCWIATQEALGIADGPASVRSLDALQLLSQGKGPQGSCQGQLDSDDSVRRPLPLRECERRRRPGRLPRHRRARRAAHARGAARVVAACAESLVHTECPRACVSGDAMVRWSRSLSTPRVGTARSRRGRVSIRVRYTTRSIIHWLSHTDSAPCRVSVSPRAFASTS